jgi:serine/threonine-protein kinase RsbW
VTVMIDSMSLAEVANAERFERSGMDADPRAASLAREAFADWLERFFDLDPIRSADLVLAVNEALANAAEFAYLRSDRPGTMDVRADYDADDKRLIVHISDHGAWRTPVSPNNPARGRGIPLMRALSDRADIEISTGGTQVSLAWDAVAQR